MYKCVDHLPQDFQNKNLPKPDHQPRDAAFAGFAVASLCLQGILVYDSCFAGAFPLLAQFPASAVKAAVSTIVRCRGKDFVYESSACAGFANHPFQLPQLSHSNHRYEGNLHVFNLSAGDKTV